MSKMSKSGLNRYINASLHRYYKNSHTYFHNEPSSTLLKGKMLFELNFIILNFELMIELSIQFAKAVVFLFFLLVLADPPYRKGCSTNSNCSPTFFVFSPFTFYWPPDP